MSNNGLEKLLKMASGKVGMSEKDLLSAIQKGDFNSISKNMNPKDVEKLNTLMKNPQAAQQMMNSDEVKEMLKKADENKK